MNAKFLFNLPVPVTLIRFLTELLVFNFGILIPFLLNGLLRADRHTNSLAAHPTAYKSVFLIRRYILKIKHFLHLQTKKKETVTL